MGLPKELPALGLLSRAIEECKPLHTVVPCQQVGHCTLRSVLSLARSV